MTVFGLLMKHPWSLELGGNHYLRFNLLLLEDGMTCYNCRESPSTRQVPFWLVPFPSLPFLWGPLLQQADTPRHKCLLPVRLVILSASLRRRLVVSGESFTRYFSVIFNTSHSKAALSQAIPRKSTT